MDLQVSIEILCSFHRKLEFSLVSAQVTLNTKDLNTLAEERLEDAKALLAAKRFWGAVYICGYAVELALKAKICKTLDWDNYPENIKDLKTHKLDVLLLFSGAEKLISKNYKGEWSVVQKWDPEKRYSTVPVDLDAATGMIKATETLLSIL